MLTLTRRVGERIRIGADIEIEVVHLSAKRVRIGVRAPRSLPVHRGELVDRIEAENIRARTEQARQLEAAPFAHDPASEIAFPAGLFGMREQRAFVLCELQEQPERTTGLTLRALVCVDSPMIRLLVVDVLEVLPGYPIERARAAASVAEEAAVAAIVTVPTSGAPATVNLAAPLVIGLESRTGAQVIVEDDRLDVRALFSPTAADT